MCCWSELHNSKYHKIILLKPKREIKSEQMTGREGTCFVYTLFLISKEFHIQTSWTWTKCSTLIFTFYPVQVYCGTLFYICLCFNCVKKQCCKNTQYLLKVACSLTEDKNVLLKKILLNEEREFLQCFSARSNTFNIP